MGVCRIITNHVDSKIEANTIHIHSTDNEAQNHSSSADNSSSADSWVQGNYMAQENYMVVDNIAKARRLSHL